MSNHSSISPAALLDEPRPIPAGFKKPLRMSVVVPTFRRVTELARCLKGIARQTLAAHEVIVVSREGDEETADLLRAHPVVKNVIVRQTGVIAAMSAGIVKASGDVITLIDDDAEPHANWLELLESHFAADPQVGGVGGRDLVYVGGQPLTGERHNVGTLSWFGRLTGNHHLGIGPARAVNVLKGVNCAYRALTLKRIGLDPALLGAGAQVHWELRLGRQFQREGWKLIYDPAILVDHFPAVRHDNDQLHRGSFSYEALVNAVHNETYALLVDASYGRAVAYLLFWILLGTAAEPGLLQGLRLLARRDSTALRRLTATARGRWMGLKTARAAERSVHRSRKRVLYVDHTARLGGGEIALLNLISNLDRSRYEPIVLLFSDGPLRASLESTSCEVIVIPLAGGVGDARKDQLGAKSLLKFANILGIVRFIWRVKRLMSVLRPDLVHTNSLKADLLGGFAARLARVPLIWHVRDRIADDYLPARVASAFRLLCRIVPRCVIANSSATLQTLGPVAARSLVQSPGGKIARVVYDGTPIDELNAVKHADQTPEPSAPLIGLVGRLSPWKGQHVFIEAAAMVLQTFPDARFQLIGSAMFGEDAYEASLRERVSTLGLENEIEFCGFCSDVSERIRRLSLLVHASTIGEPFGQVVIEGMVAGKPVIATRGGGVPEIVEDGVTGILIPMGEVSALARAIVRVLRDPQRADQLATRGRQHVVNCFNIQRTASEIQKLYDEMLAGAPTTQSAPAFQPSPREPSAQARATNHEAEFAATH